MSNANKSGERPQVGSGDGFDPSGAEGRPGASNDGEAGGSASLFDPSAHPVPSKDANGVANPVGDFALPDFLRLREAVYLYTAASVHHRRKKTDGSLRKKRERAAGVFYAALALVDTVNAESERGSNPEISRER